MPAEPKGYGVLEQLPADLQYLKQVVWEGWEATQRWEEALDDDNPEYFCRLATVMQEHFRGLPLHEQVERALRDRELINNFTERFRSDDHPEIGALFFIWGALKYPGCTLKKQPV